MEKYFGNAYRGDPGVPHSGPDALSTYGSGRTPSPSSPGSTLTCVNGNQMDKKIRDSYYFNWPVYFP